MKQAKLLCSGLVSLCVMLGISPLTWAGEAEEEVAAAARKWAAAIRTADPDAIVKMYDKEAVFWATSSPTVRQDPAAIREYFVWAEQLVPGYTMTFEKPMLIRVYGDMAVNSGMYSGTYVINGETKRESLRYSFTYIKRDGEWLIIDHHSSRMPTPPKP